jgi:hypothetical protein
MLGVPERLDAPKDEQAMRQEQERKKKKINFGTLRVKGWESGTTANETTHAAAWEGRKATPKRAETADLLWGERLERGTDRTRYERERTAVRINDKRDVLPKKREMNCVTGPETELSELDLRFTHRGSELARFLKGIELVGYGG